MKRRVRFVGYSPVKGFFGGTTGGWGDCTTSLASGAQNLRGMQNLRYLQNFGKL